MSPLIEFVLDLFGEIVAHSGYWRFFFCFMGGLALASVVWWKMSEGSLANAIAAGAIVTMSLLGVFWERAAE